MERVQTDDPIFVRDLNSKALLVQDVASIARARANRQRARQTVANQEELMTVLMSVQSLMRELQQQVTQLTADVTKLKERTGLCR